MLPPSKDPKKIAAIVIAVLLAFWFLRTVNDVLERGAEREAFEERAKKMNERYKKLDEDIKNVRQLKFF